MRTAAKVCETTVGIESYCAVLKLTDELTFVLITLFGESLKSVRL